MELAGIAIPVWKVEAPEKIRAKCILVVRRHKALLIILAIVDRESGDPVDEGNSVNCYGEWHYLMICFVHTRRDGNNGWDYHTFLF